MLELASLEKVQSVTVIPIMEKSWTKLESDYGVCLELGFVFPVEAKPILSKKTPIFKIKNEDAIKYDPTKGEAFLQRHEPSDPIFFANIAEDTLNAAEIISGKSLKFETPYPDERGGYGRGSYCVECSGCEYLHDGLFSCGELYSGRLYSISHEVDCVHL